MRLATTRQEPRKPQRLCTAVRGTKSSAEILLFVIVCSGIAAVAYADSHVETISLAISISAVALGATTFRLRVTLPLVFLCVALHDLFSPCRRTRARVALTRWLSRFCRSSLVVEKLRGHGGISPQSSAATRRTPKGNQPRRRSSTALVARRPAAYPRHRAGQLHDAGIDRWRRLLRFYPTFR